MMRGIATTLFLLMGCVHGFTPMMHHDPTPFVEIAQHSAAAFASKLSGSYTDSLVQHPLYTKMLTGGALATCGDAIAQSRTDDAYDKRRAASFMLFDMAYRALQHVSFPIIVHECQGQYFGSLLSAAHIAQSQIPTEYAAALEQTLASQLGIVPFLYYPVFFALTGFMQGLSASGSVDRAKENFLPLMKRNLLFWIPVQFVQFGFIDEQLQIPFLSVAGLCWTFILSVSAGSAKSYSTSQEQIAQQDGSTELPDDSDSTFTNAPPLTGVTSR